MPFPWVPGMGRASLGRIPRHSCDRGQHLQEVKQQKYIMFTADENSSIGKAVALVRNALSAPIKSFNCRHYVKKINANQTGGKRCPE